MGSLQKCIFYDNLPKGGQVADSKHDVYDYDSEKQEIMTRGFVPESLVRKFKP